MIGVRTLLWPTLVAALLGVSLRGMDNNILTQVGLIVLVGLAAKNAILIVEFAKQLEESGKELIEATVEASRLRLRPILMTAFAFIIGLMPLVIAAGAGAGARRSLGTAVVSGLALATLLIIMVPIFYYVLERAREGWLKTRDEATGGKAASETAPGSH